MFGQNPLRKKDLQPDGRLWVQDVFHTIQGEGPFAGECAVFIRLGGCNLACWFCDTDFETGDLHADPETLLFRVRDEVAKGHGTNLLVITGGEPLRQNVVPFVRLALSWGYRVQFETAGTLWYDRLAELDSYINCGGVTYVVSPKTGRVDPEIAKRASHYKYVVRAGDADADDGLPVLSSQHKAPRRMPPARPPRHATVWVQPMDEYDEDKNKANLVHATATVLRFGYRLCVQVHKLAGVP